MIKTRSEKMDRLVCGDNCRREREKEKYLFVVRCFIFRLERVCNATRL